MARNIDDIQRQATAQLEAIMNDPNTPTIHNHPGVPEDCIPSNLREQVFQTTKKLPKEKEKPKVAKMVDAPDIDTTALFADDDSDIYGQGEHKEKFKRLLENGPEGQEEELKKLLQETQPKEGAEQETENEIPGLRGFRGRGGMPNIEALMGGGGNAGMGRGGMEALLGGRGGGMEALLGGRGGGMEALLGGRGGGMPNMGNMMGKSGGMGLPKMMGGAGGASSQQLQALMGGRGGGMPGGMRMPGGMGGMPGLGGLPGMGGMSRMQSMTGLGRMQEVGDTAGFGSMPGMGGTSGMGSMSPAMTSMPQEMGGLPGMGSMQRMGGMARETRGMGGGAEEMIQQMIQQEQLAANNCTDSLASGMNTIIILDTSASMYGESLTQSKQAIEDFILGLEDNSMDYGLEENLALVICGGDQPQVAQHLTNEYQCIRQQIAAAQTHGRSHLMMSLLLVMGTLERAHEMVIGGHSIFPRVLLFSNGNIAEAGQGIPGMMGGGGGSEQEMTQFVQLLENVLKQHHMKMSYIPIGNSNQNFASLIGSISYAEVVPIEEVRSLSRVHLQHRVAGVVKEQSRGLNVTNDMVKNIAASSYPGMNEKDINSVIKMLEDDKQHEARRQAREQQQQGGGRMALPGGMGMPGGMPGGMGMPGGIPGGMGMPGGMPGGMGMPMRMPGGMRMPMTMPGGMGMAPGMRMPMMGGQHEVDPELQSLAELGMTGPPRPRQIRPTTPSSGQLPFPSQGGRLPFPSQGGGRLPFPSQNGHVS